MANTAGMCSSFKSEILAVFGIGLSRRGRYHIQHHRRIGRNWQLHAGWRHGHDGKCAVNQRHGGHLYVQRQFLLVEPDQFRRV